MDAISCSVMVETWLCYSDQRPC